NARQAILNALKSLPPRRWLDPTEFLEDIQLKTPDFLFPERSLIESAGNRSYYYSRYSSAYHGQPKTLLATFDRLEAAVINGCLNGVLFQLGLVELGRLEAESSTEWSVFRLTPLGVHLLQQKELPPAATAYSGKLLVQPNFQVMAMGPVGLDTLARLDLFADREQIDRGAFQYRLSRESVYQAQQLGLSVAEITKILLAEAGQESLPQNVQRSLEEWGSHHKRIVFRQGVSLLQAADATLLDRLLTAPATAELLARPIAADVALVSPQMQAGLIEALMAQALLPAVSGADPQAADRSVFVQDDGVIEPIHAVPSLHLRGRLAQLAEVGDDGHWRLTPTSVRRAGGSKRKVLQILAELETLHRGKLPEPVRVMVKKWGGYFGQAAVETLTLIEFSNREIMDELLGDSHLKALLTPFATNDRALVIVAPDNLEQIKNKLADLGIVVKDGLAGPALH
ncbi:MAG: helicase-associated domain-containing protein, partial [Anaerolineae bacterium]|nr:helicase-associated domain-containing protein [Anaerolineae bacterium]